MVIEIKENEKGKNIKFSGLLPFEYAVVEKVFEEPKSGEATGPDGKFEWFLYALQVYEVNTLDLSSGEQVKTNYDGEQMASFVSAKSLREALDKVDVGTKVRIRAKKPEGKSYAVYFIQEEADQTPTKKISKEAVQELKSKGATKEEVSKMTGAKIEDIESLYEEDL